MLNHSTSSLFGNEQMIPSLFQTKTRSQHINDVTSEIFLYRRITKSKYPDYNIYGAKNIMNCFHGIVTGIEIVEITEINDDFIIYSSIDNMQPVNNLNYSTHDGTWIMNNLATKERYNVHTLSFIKFLHSKKNT